MVISSKFRGGLRGTVNLPFHAEMCFRFRTYFANEITRETEMKTRYAIPWLPVNDKPSD